jgi:hypothetical protein
MPDDAGRLSHWDCWGSHGEMQHVNKPVPNSTPEAAMDELPSKARFVFGDQDWSAWDWSAHAYATRVRRVIRFSWRDGAWMRPPPR